MQFPGQRIYVNWGFRAMPRDLATLLHNEELYSLYYPCNVVRVKIKMGWECNQNERRYKCFQNFN